MTVGALEHVVAALGARLDVGVRWNGESLDRLLDATHADLVERLLARLQAFGWEDVPEASFAIAGERSSIDGGYDTPGGPLAGIGAAGADTARLAGRWQ
jgi:hypothetical protein